MRIRVQNELLLLNILVILLILIITLFPSNVLRIILGLAFLLFFPGYTLVSALFPKGSSLDSIERVALSFGLSVIISPLTGFILNYTPWGIKLYPILISLTIFILITSVIAWHQRRRLVEEERFTISFNLSLPPWKTQRSLDRILSAILITVILGVTATLGYAIATPKASEKFTEFYILGLEGKSIDYPTKLKVGEEGKVIVGIINREHERVSYQVEVKINGKRNNQVEPPELGHNEEWEEIVSFTPDKAADNQKVEFLLYKNGESQPYLKPLHLWIGVNE